MLHPNLTSFGDLLYKYQYDLRSTFYLLAPSETYFKNVDDVPNITQNVMKVFVPLIIVEQIVFLMKGGQLNGSINAAVTSLSAGIIFLIPNLFTRKVLYSTYEWFYANFSLYEMPYDSILTYIITLLLLDMMFYWMHRASHEINLMWTAHQVHHSSEDYNLPTALRQSFLKNYFEVFIYLPLALFIPPPIFIVHSHLNLVYQFWIHTEVIDNIGTVGEFILNTASHHRVHHARNPYCIDKNYGGVLIIWDRIFGTFQAEMKEEKIAYGLVHPIESFDPIYVQFFHLKYLFGRLLEAKSWNERLSILFKGPGWEEGSPRLGFHEKLPKLEYPVTKYGKNLSFNLNLYVWIHFVFLGGIFTLFSLESKRHSLTMVTVVTLLIMYSLTCFGRLFDDKPSAYFLDSLRCLSLVTLNIFYNDMFKRFLFNSYWLHLVFTWLNIISVAYISCLAMLKMTNQETSQSKNKIKNS